MARCVFVLWTATIICLFRSELASAYDGDTCCKIAKADGVFVDEVPSFVNQTCGQVYHVDSNAAPPLYIRYSYCRANCSGVGLSKPDEPRQWAAPIVQFILPSVIFSMTIPRQKKIASEKLFDRELTITRWLWVNKILRLARSFLLFTLILVPVIIDTLIWIFVIVVGAAHMLVGGLYEAHLDYRIVNYVDEMSRAESRDHGELRNEKRKIIRHLLVTVACGNLVLGKGLPETGIPDSLTITSASEVARPGSERQFQSDQKVQSRLLNLLGAQYSFGSAVGSPVIFYLGAFVFTILDLKNNPSDQDSAISLSFGMEWMIIVHVAIVSGCLLASNNPSTASVIVGGRHAAQRSALHRVNSANVAATINVDEFRRPLIHRILGWHDAYASEFQPVSLWSRGINKMMWIRESTAWNENEIHIKGTLSNAMHISIIGWFMKIFLPTLALIGIPPAAGGIVAYLTPPKGVACRSLSFIVYAICQFALAIIATTRNAVDDGKPSSWGWETSRPKLTSLVKNGLKWLLRGKTFRAICAAFWFFSLAAAVGGTTMQITGVYRNCVCYAGAENWWGIIKGTKNPSVQLATDTQSARDSSDYWISIGIAATVFMVLNCYIGWWYQRLIRRRFTDIVVTLALSVPEPEGNERSDHSQPGGSVSSIHEDTNPAAPSVEPPSPTLLGEPQPAGDNIGLPPGPPVAYYDSSADSRPSSGSRQALEESNESPASIPLLERPRPPTRRQDYF